MSLLTKARRKAKQKNIEGTIELSKAKGKKLVLITPQGKKINFGSDVSQTYLEGALEKKRDAYKSRHSKIKLKDGRLSYKVKNTPSFLSWHILWD